MNHSKLKTDKGYPTYASKALSQLTEWKFEDFLEIRYDGSDSQISSSREAKVDLRKELIEDYQKLIELARKESFKAYYRIAQLDEEIASAEATATLNAADGIERNPEITRP